MIDRGFSANFVKIGAMDVDVELNKETDKEHLQEIIDDLLTGFNCSKGRISFKIGDVRLSDLGRWKNSWWPVVKMLK